jgi:signal peptidase I
MTGESMIPVFRQGDVRQVFKKPYKELKEGDIALIWYDNKWVAHSLHQKQIGGWVTKGINNPTPDVELLTENSYGGVVFADQNARYP